MSDDQSEEKSEDASDRKLRKLREDGIVSSSQVGSNFFGLAAGILVAVLLLPWMIARLQNGFDLAFDLAQSDDIYQTGPLRHFLFDIHAPIGVMIIAIIAAAVAFKVLSQGGFIFSMTHVAPDLSKVSPTKGLQNLFKGRAWTDFAATLIRFSIMILVCVILAIQWGPTLLNLDVCVPGCAHEVAWRIIRTLLIACGLLVLAAVVFDLITQKIFFLQEQRMTKTEVKQEQKEMLGQPEIRQERRRLQRDSAATAGTIGVSVATAYFTYGDRVVALIFDPIKAPLPKVAAKSREASTTIEMITQLASRGVPGMEDEEIVAACELLPNGSNVPRKIFMPLAAKLRDMLG